MQNTETASDAHRSIVSKSRPKRFCLSETEQNTSGAHPLSGKVENDGNHHPWRGLNVA
jgi:hypothetical protein